MSILRFSPRAYGAILSKLPSNRILAQSGLRKLHARLDTLISIETEPRGWPNGSFGLSPMGGMAGQCDRCLGAGPSTCIARNILLPYGIGCQVRR